MLENLLRVLIKHDGQELIDRQHSVEGACTEQFPGPFLADQVAERPVRVQRASRVRRNVFLLVV